MTRIFFKTSIIYIVLLTFLVQPCGAALDYSQSRMSNSLLSYTSSAVSDTEEPTAPAGLSVTNRTNTTISISWAKSQDNKAVKGYQVYRDGRKTVTIVKTNYTIKELVPGREYVFTVKAYDAAGNLSESSSSLRAETLPDTQMPTTPGALYAITANYTSIMLKWNPSTDNTSVKGYEIYCNEGRKASSATSQYECKGLEPGREYTFYVKAYDLAGNFSANSNKIIFATKPDNSAPSIPGGIKAASVTETEINLTWSPSSDNLKIKGYEVYCDGIRKAKPSKTAYSCKCLIPGKSYIFTIKALDTAGNYSLLSKPLTVTTVKDLKAPTVPAGLKVKSAKGSSIALEWVASTDNVKVKGYRIYCNGLEIATSTRASRTVRVSKGLGINIIWVKAYDLAGNLSAGSNSVIIFF